MSIICAKCESECEIDGEYPKFFAWCDECNDYVQGFDCLDYASDFMANEADRAKDEAKDSK